MLFTTIYYIRVKFEARQFLNSSLNFREFEPQFLINLFLIKNTKCIHLNSTHHVSIQGHQMAISVFIKNATIFNLLS